MTVSWLCEHICIVCYVRSRCYFVKKRLNIICEHLGNIKKNRKMAKLALARQRSRPFYKYKEKKKKYYFHH